MILHEIVVFEMISHLVKSPQNRVFRSKEYMKIYFLGSEFSTQRVCICPSATEHIVGTETRACVLCPEFGVDRATCRNASWKASTHQGRRGSAQCSVLSRLKEGQNATGKRKFHNVIFSSDRDCGNRAATERRGRCLSVWALPSLEDLASRTLVASAAISGRNTRRAEGRRC